MKSENMSKTVNDYDSANIFATKLNILRNKILNGK